ncbi:protein of unknown function [Paenibacillus sp. UNC496MF]|uniref:DUF3846 domain-containing protein n=1 Tax=Paenibacillus sp. UNC496MF TaxID=1502753 RepID=UPI0008F2CE43|nr:DUF3846 domain-containing protein [Paenibacillus sp. UNC496MF]SFJ64631.1 protein of unknown function [Paenibacillus sp. UNC496MF]
MLRILVVEPDSIQDKEIEYTLDAMKDIVDGHLNEVQISNKFVLIYNLDGDTLRLPINNQYVGGPIFGTFFVTRIDVDETYISLTDEEVESIKENFIRKEV